MDDILVTWEVRWTSSRPVRPDEHRAWVTLAVADDAAAVRASGALARDMVMATNHTLAMVPGAGPPVMPTRLTLHSVEM